jgi:hypothetical protein
VPEHREDAPHVAGSGGHDVNAGISLSGLGGEVLRTHDEDEGLRRVGEQGERIGWGHLARDAGPQPAAPNEGTGLTDKGGPGDAG